MGARSMPRSTCGATSAAPTIHVPHIDYLSILPMLIMMGGALALMVVSSLFRQVRTVGPGRPSPRRRRSPPWWPRCSSGTRSAPTAPR